MMMIKIGACEICLFLMMMVSVNILSIS